MHPQSLIDCYGDLWLATAVSVLGAAVFLQYLRIGRIWLNAAKRYNAAWQHNPWIFQLGIFWVCGFVHCSDLISMPAPTVAVYLKIFARMAILGLAQLFLSNVRLQLFERMVARVEMGESAIELAQRLKEGEIDTSELINRISEKVKALEILHNESFSHKGVNTRNRLY